MLTRRDIIIKWSSYGVVSLGLLLLFSLTLRGTEILGVRMFLPPLLVGVVASVEDTRAGAPYGFAVGLLCDLTLSGTFPCVYTLSFTLAAVCCSLLAKGVLQRGVLCSLAVTGLTFFFLDAFNMLSLWLRARAPFSEMAQLALRETVASCLLLVVCHPALLALHRKFTI